MRPYLKVCALAALCISGGAQAASNWQDLKVGGGGYVRNLAIAPDGTLVGRTDTNGAYLWNGSAWVQLVNSSSIPAALIAQNPANTGAGVYELQMAPSNSSIMYMAFDGYVYQSTNKGSTWTQTAFSQNAGGMNPNDTNAQVGQKMAVDPNNSNIVYVGTENRGLYVTTTGGASWSTVSIPTGSGAGITGILFYPGGGQVNGVTQVIYACSTGSGVYVSSNGGTTWTLTAGGPTSLNGAAIDSSGNYYAATNGGVYKYSGNTWTMVVGGDTFQAVAVNPLNPGEVVAVNLAGQIYISYNGGSTWSGKNVNSSLVTADIPWLLDANSFNGTPSPYFYLDSGGLQFSTQTNGQLFLSGGTGAWTMTVPPSGVAASTALVWTDMSVGIENLVANGIVVPPGGVPVLASWDRPFFKITNPNAFPTTYGSVNSDTIEMGWSVDYASSNPSVIVGLSDWGSHEQSGYSTDGGATWTYFSSSPPGVPGAYFGGTIAASTPQNIIWAPANRSQPYYTLNQGASWTGINLPGVSNWGNFDTAYYLVQRSVTADRVNPNTFYLYYPGYGVFTTTNGGASWTNVKSGYIESNSTFSGYNSTISSVPGNAGNLFYTSGWLTGSTATSPLNNPLYRSTNGGVTWTAVPNVLSVSCFGFGAAAAGQSYPAIYIVGYVNNTFGIWQSVDNAQSWTNIGTYPMGALDVITTISGDPNNYGEVYVGFGGGGYAYLPAAGSVQAPPVPMAPTNLSVQ
jgi:hypothetical protein